MHNAHNLATALGIVGHELRKAKIEAGETRIAAANKAYSAVLALFTDEDYAHLSECFVDRPCK